MSVPSQNISVKLTDSKKDLHQTLFNLVLGQLSPSKIDPNPKTNPNPDPNSNPNRGQFSGYIYS